MSRRSGRSDGADFGAFNIPTVATTSTCVKAGWIHLSPLIRHPPAPGVPGLLRHGSRPHPSAEDRETTSPTATAVPVVTTWTPSPPDPSPAPATPTLVPTPEIAANSAVILRSPSPRPRPTSPTTIGITGGGGSTRTATARTHARKFCCRRASSTSTSAQLMPAASKPVHGWPLSPER